jgi:23S rRNA (uracil1939-C5)-methyltransferase
MAVSPSDSNPSNRWQQGDLVEVNITDLGDRGEGVGRSEGRVAFVPDTVPGDRALVRLVRVKRQYARGKLHQLIEASPHRRQPRCIVADKCGGCQWQHIDDEYQLQAKRDRVVQALERIAHFDRPPVDDEVIAIAPLGYRNKATYPVGRAQSGGVQAGYYRKGSHRLVNLNRCPVQDDRLDPFLAEIKQDIERRGWSIYDERRHQGNIRHIGLRLGRRTGEVLLTLVARSDNLSGLDEQAKEWMQRYPQLVGVCLNLNRDRTNAIFGNETRCAIGRSYLEEQFAGLTFQLRPETFFQVNTEAAEALLDRAMSQLEVQGSELLLDAYCGVGTFTLPLARRVREAIGVEVQESAVEQARENARINGIDNATFVAGKVEVVLGQLEETPDVVLLDPPRKGCDRAVVQTLLDLAPDRIVYISCKPSTLARDLAILCAEGSYRLTRVQLADFFAQTAHVEAVAFLNRAEALN